MRVNAGKTQIKAVPSKEEVASELDDDEEEIHERERDSIIGGQIPKI